VRSQTACGHGQCVVFVGMMWDEKLQKQICNHFLRINASFACHFAHIHTSCPLRRACLWFLFFCNANAVARFLCFFWFWLVVFLRGVLPHKSLKKACFGVSVCLFRGVGLFFFVA